MTSRIPKSLVSLIVFLYIMIHLWLLIVPTYQYGSKIMSFFEALTESFRPEVIKYVDCSVLEGHRDEERQNKLFDEGKTKVKYPNGRHNAKPSRAVDVVPYPVDWKDRERFHLFAGFVLGIARSMNIKLRWGGDWNMNFEVDDNKFDDFPHFELLKE